MWRNMCNILCSDLTTLVTAPGSVVTQLDSYM